MVLKLVVLVQMLLVWWPLEDALNDVLQLEQGVQVLGVCEDGGLVASDHEEHVHHRGYLSPKSGRFNQKKKYK